MKAAIVSETKRYVTCPDCSGRLGGIDHLLGRAFTTRWSCDDCGKYWGLQFSVDGSLEVSVSNEPPLISKLMVLEMPPQSKPVTVVLRVRTGSDYNDDQHEYFYNDHTCTTNWLRDVARIVIDGEDDPHGLFGFKCSLPDQSPTEPVYALKVLKMAEEKLAAEDEAEVESWFATDGGSK